LSQIIYGTDHIKADKEKTFSFSPTRVAGITAGKKQSVRRKHDGNEDSLAWLPGDQGELLLLADSHYGSLASKFCMDSFKDLFEQGSGDTLRRLLRVHLQLDDRVREAKNQPEAALQRGCSTTLISAFVSKNKLYYASTGDSRLWLVRNDSLRDVLGNDDIRPLFVGDDHAHLFQYANTLEKMGCIDAVTERHEVAEVLLRLHEIQRLVRTSQSSEAVASLITEIEEITRIKFPIGLEDLMESWHTMHLELPTMLPQTGSLNLFPGDLIMMATDGIDEEESDCSTDKIAQLLIAKLSLEKRADKVLGACMGRNGGNDNIAFILASF